MPVDSTTAGSSSGERELRLPTSLHVALASAEEPRERSYSSGTPHALLDALEDVVSEVTPVGAGPHPRVRRAALMLGRAQSIRGVTRIRADMRAGVAASQLRTPMVLARTFAVRKRMAPVSGIDVCIQHGAEFSLAGGIRYVTFEDSTIVQAARSYAWPHLAGMTARDLDVFARRQRRVYERAAACCTMSEWAARSIVTDYGIDPQKVHVVGVGPNHAVDPPDAREWWPPRFLFVGADWKRKNGSRVLSAFEAVRSRCPDATLEVVGNHPRLQSDGVLEHGFLSRSDEADRDRLKAIFDRATVLVAPSLHDPSPIVHAEAGGAGIGSIGSRNGGAATIIGEGGILVDPEDDEQLIRAMITLCDPDRAREAGARALARAQLLSWRQVAERLLRAARIPGVDSSSLAAFL
jgi:glycosyltransferase involved in cell wall biosynthesis